MKRLLRPPICTLLPCHSPALSAHLEGKSADPVLLESSVSFFLKQIGEEQVGSGQAACAATLIESGYPFPVGQSMGSKLPTQRAQGARHK